MTTTLNSAPHPRPSHTSRPSLEIPFALTDFAIMINREKKYGAEPTSAAVDSAAMRRRAIFLERWAPQNAQEKEKDAEKAPAKEAEKEDNTNAENEVTHALVDAAAADNWTDDAEEDDTTHDDPADEHDDAFDNEVSGEDVPAVASYPSLVITIDDDDDEGAIEAVDPATPSLAAGTESDDDEIVAIATPKKYKKKPIPVVVVEDDSDDSDVDWQGRREAVLAARVARKRRRVVV